MCNSKTKKNQSVNNPFQDTDAISCGDLKTLITRLFNKYLSAFFVCMVLQCSAFQTEVLAVVTNLNCISKYHENNEHILLTNNCGEAMYLIFYVNHTESEAVTIERNQMRGFRHYSGKTEWIYCDAVAAKETQYTCGIVSD